LRRLLFRCLERLRPADEPEKPSESGELMRAIIKVRQPGYVPQGVRVRSRISDDLITAEFPSALLDPIRADDRVISVEPSHTLHRID
jgi:hypothetical protein